MKERILFSLIVLFSVTLGLSQTKMTKVKDPNLKDSYEEIYVLKSNRKIKEGSYKRIDNAKISVEGNYKENKRVGIWKVYQFNNNVVEIEINYDSGILKYLSMDSISKKEIMLDAKIQDTGDRPALMIASSNMQMYYLMRLIMYPQSVRDKGIEGKVIISVQIDSNGKITDYIPLTSKDKSLETEAIRVIKKMPLEFLPAYKNGIPVASEMRIPIKFTIH